MMAKNGYDFYLEKCLLPIAPEKLQVKINNANDTVTLINEGEANILKTPGLTDIEFECRIPQVRYPFATYKSGFKDAVYFLNYFEQLKTSKKPFQFIVSRAMPNGKKLFSTNMKVSMEDYKIIEQAEDGFDMTVKINLKQYRSYSTKTVTIKTESKVKVKSTRSAGTNPAPKTSKIYTVVKGDCLWSIAKKFYGDGSKWKKIYEANPKVCGKPYKKGGITYVMIHPGDKLTIPSV